MKSATHAVLLALLAFAAGSRAQVSLPSMSEMQALPGCAQADWTTMTTNAALSECQEFAADQADIACPAACRDAYLALGEQCYAEVTKYMFAKLGSVLGDDVVLPVINATLEACEQGLLVDPAPLVALAEAVFAPYPACDNVDWEGAMGAGCSVQEAMSAATGTCPSDCQAYLSTMGEDCLVQFFFGVLEHQSSVSDSDKASIEQAIRNGYRACVGGRRRSRKMLAGAAGPKVLQANPLAAFFLAPGSLAAATA
ncbi:hypothetical protein ABPG75_000480 [Micractinium tetrahymenae]